MKFKLYEDSRKFKIYTDGKVDKRVYDGDEIPDGFYQGSHYKRTAWNKGLTAETDDRVKANVEATHSKRKETGNYVAWNKGLTKDTDERVAKNIESTKETIKNRYGVDNISQYVSKQPDYKVWNKGLTAETDSRMKKVSDSRKGITAWNKGKSIPGHPQSEETKEKIRKSHISVEFKQKRYDTMKNNGTLFVQDSKAEQDYLSYLKTLYSDDDIVRQYFDKDRYPYKCDFYIPSEDLFIEVNGNWTHGKHPFDENNEEDIKTLELWKEKSKNSAYYKNAIYTWTILDVNKKKTAEKNNLNYKMIYY